MMPSCSTVAYTEEQIAGNPNLALEENFYTAPASITGLPAVVVGGVQFIGQACFDASLLQLAKSLEGGRD
jgi:Asp-tRNA(Asn)/Glu-tRNA(Gln) amidotransferase A subunit family amidase